MKKECLVCKKEFEIFEIDINGWNGEFVAIQNRVCNKCIFDEMLKKQIISCYHCDKMMVVEKDIEYKVCQKCESEGEELPWELDPEREAWELDLES